MDSVIRRTLPNGLRVAFLKKPISSVSIVISVGSGFLDEEKGFVGISHLLEHLLFDGTKKWKTEFEFNDAAEQLGGTINGCTEEYCTSFEIKVSKEDFSKAAELLSDLIQNPLLLERDVKKEKKVIEAELLSRKDYLKKNPVKSMLYKYMDGMDPIKYLDEELKELPSLNRNKVIAYYKKHYYPKNMVIGVVGDLEEPFKVLESLFNNKSDFVPNKVLPNFQFPKKVIERVPDVDKVLSTYFCWFGPSFFEEERAVFEVCAKVLAKGENGIVKEIRFENGLAYEVDASVNSDERKGVFVVAVKTSKKNVARVQRIVKEKVALLESVSKEEVERAKKSVLAENTLDMEEYIEVARTVSNFELYNKVTPYEGYFEKIKSVSVSEVRSFAKKCFGEDFVMITSKKKN
ncbi:MAG: pitrilysin family protein [archaeon]|jgi:zinc protease